MSRPARRPDGSLLATLVLFGVALLVPLVVRDPYRQHLAVLALFAVGLAVSLNLVVGLAGQVSFAHAAFYAIGAYTSALLTTGRGVNPWLGLLAAFVVTGAIAFITGVPVLRLRGHYLGIATIGLQAIVVVILLQWGDVTRGPAGITSIPPLMLGGAALREPAAFYYPLLAVIGLIVAASFAVQRSRIGLQLAAVREDEMAARAVGVNTPLHKAIAFTGSAAMAGVVGGLYAHYIGSIDPFVFDLNLSATTLLMVLVGGLGSIPGTIVAGAALSILPETLRGFQSFRMIAYGTALILIIIFLPQGLSGLVSHLRRGRGGPTPVGAPPAVASGPSVDSLSPPELIQP